LKFAITWVASAFVPLVRLFGTEQVSADALLTIENKSKNPTATLRIIPNLPSITSLWI
jgi:hypothetical protein